MSDRFHTLHHVIIGGGEAGTRAALTLRERGAQNITLIGDEPGLPYERPPLSKPEGEAVVIRPIATDFSGIHTRFGERATAIDRSRQQILTQTGEAVPYDRLLLATGAQPRNPWSVPVLRRHDHATTIFESIRPNVRAVVVGAGLIGLELAAEFAKRRAQVTVVEAAPSALGRAVPADLAEVLVDRHRMEGVEIVFSARLNEVTQTRVLLDDGRVIDADLVVAAVGAVPDTALAEAAGLKCENGIHVDAGLATDDPNIFAVGDCAAVDHGLYGRVRIETWRNARDQGILAASAMLGEPVQFNALPWFWSDQYDPTFSK